MEHTIYSHGTKLFTWISARMPHTTQSALHHAEINHTCVREPPPAWIYFSYMTIVPWEVIERSMFGIYATLHVGEDGEATTGTLPNNPWLWLVGERN